ncbi:MAG: helix-turn-helix domain-containing protein [Candidatus Izemoplasmatales bacterium]|nr:helix-turn-helix domain-containing protein [Candidatus Izemoplasmatales bacterium]
MVIIENRKRQYADRDTILRHLNLLETNDMNISVTAREIGKDRSTIYRWKKQYWQEYLDNKKKINEQVRDIETVKLYTVKEFEELKDIFTKVLRLALNRMIEILSDPELLKTLSHKELIQLISVASPYCVEKVGLAGADNPAETMEEKNNAFVQNIVQQLNVKGIKNMRNNYKQNQV